MTRDLDDDIPGPDDEPTAAEKARARSFGDLVDRAVAGRAPAAMSPDDRALIEVATVIRGAAGKVELEASRASNLIEAALAAAVDKDRPRTTTLPPIGGGNVTPITAAPKRRWLPWSIAGATSAIAAAAIAMLIAGVGRHAPARAPVARAPLPEMLRSRPADDLVGVIARDRSGDAATRIDAIYADRLDGYRELALRGGTR
ncbi:MAG TPA: hypothetical protein VL463_03390 [Kofleriaceae bacterium]|nr:hypothetical protein [Kofleriaceae bacterium]